MLHLQLDSGSVDCVGPEETVDRFVCIYADTLAGKKAHFRTRYAVFCEEKGFEKPGAFPEGMEWDEYYCD